MKVRTFVITIASADRDNIYDEDTIYAAMKDSVSEFADSAIEIEETTEETK